MTRTLVLLFSVATVTSSLAADLDVRLTRVANDKGQFWWLYSIRKMDGMAAPRRARHSAWTHPRARLICVSRIWSRGVTAFW